MQKLTSYRLILVSAFLLTCFLVNAQNKIDTSKMEGKWVFDKIEFVKPQNDSSEIRAAWKGTIVSFKKGVFTTTNGDFKKDGDYHFSGDGKTFYQGEMGAEVVQLDSQWFVVKIDDGDLIVYFKRLDTPK